MRISAINPAIYFEKYFRLHRKIILETFYFSV